MTRNGMFGGTISGGRRCCVDRDRRRIGVHDGLWTHVRPGYRMLVCRERRYSGGESLVAMMETADFRQRYDLAHGGRLDGARLRDRLQQGIGNQLIRNGGPTNENGTGGKVACRSRLGGLLNFYHREVA